MTQETATTALVYDARGAVAGAKEFEAASEKVKAANKNAAAASDVLTAASERLQKAQDAVNRAAERVQKAQESAAKAAEKFGAQSEQAAKAAERVAQATETASRAQDRLSKAQDAAVASTERMAAGLSNQERRLAAIEAKYAPAIAAENRLAQTKEYLNGVIERGGPQMERAQRLLAALTEQQKAAAQAAQQQGQAMAAGTAATVRAARAQEAAAASGRNFNATIGQVGFQVQDFANQVAYGGNVATAAGMQLGQLLGSLGPMGAAIGAVVNVGGILAGVLSSSGDEAELTSTSFTNYAKALEFAKRASEEMKGASEGVRAALEAEGRAAVDAAQKRLTKADAELKALEAGMMGTTDAAAAAGIAINYLWNSGKVKELRQEIEVLRGTLGQYNDGAREVRVATEQGSGALKRNRDALEDSRESLRQQIAATKLLADNEDLSNAGKLRARLETEALTRARKAGQTEIDAGTKALINEWVAEQKRIDAMEEDEKASKKAASAAETLEKTRKKVVDELDRDVAAQKRLAEIAGMSASKQAEANTQTRVAAELAKAHTTASTEEGKAIAAKVKEAERWKRVAADEKMIKGAEEQLAYAKQELSLMGQSASVRDRALKSIQIQRDAVKEWGDTTSDAARKWIGLQEQIADTQAIKAYQEEITRVAEDIAKDWSETLYDAIVLRDKQTSIVDSFRDLFKRIAIEAIKANIVLPITQQIVGAVPSLFGIQAPTSGGQTITLNGQTYTAANQNGGMGGMGGQALSLGSKLVPNSWTSSIMSSIDLWGAESLGIGSVAQGPTLSGAAGYVPAGTGLSAYLGAAGAGAGAGGLVGGYLGTQTNSKAVGGISGAAAGAVASMALAGSIVPGIGTAIGAIAGAIMGMIGTQKATVGKTASADVTIASNGKTATYGNILTDNDGDPAAGQALGTALSGIYSIAAMGGGSLVKDFGIGSTAKNGLYVGGSVPYKEFGEDIAGLLRYTLLDQGGLKDGGTNTLAALKASKAKDWEEAAKDIGLGASIDAGNTALREMVKTLGGVTDAAKKATAESFAPMFEELARAQKLGIDGAYKALATDQLKAYLDQLRNPPDFTQVQTDVAALTGQFQAAREAYAQLNPAMVTYVDQIEKETKARLAANLNKSLDQQIAEASGRGYVNQITGFLDALTANSKSLAAVGEPATRAQQLFNASLVGLLKTLTADQLTDVVQTFGGNIATMAGSITAAAAATEQATQFQTLWGQILQSNISESIAGLNEQRSAAQSTKTAWENLQKSAGNAVSSLLVSDYSTLSPEAKLKEAMRQFDDLTAKAAAGDVDAGTQAVAMKDTVLGLARGFHASSEGYVSIFNHVSEGLTGVESVASRQVTLAAQQVNRLDTLITLQQDMLKATQQPAQADINSVISGLNSSNFPAIAQWAQSQGPAVMQQILSAADYKLGWQNNPLRYSASSDIANLNIPAADWMGVLRSVGYGGNGDPNEVNSWIAAYGKKDAYENAMRGYAKSHGIPGYAVGTDSAPPGMAWVGEQGRELVQMAGGERVYPHSVSMDIARSWAANDRWGGNVVPFRGQSGGSGGVTVDFRGMERRLDDAVDLLKALVYENSELKTVNKKQAAELSKLRTEAADRDARPRRTGTYGQ
ncbi:hypothetical protein [Azospirillum sp.]|uniref:hypothetical protein n=1 Tax=Azospirillum sp. TaxID=34012 RepID=UPI002D269907|nr:hypothetical protein [Azospirillum sp.]HYF88970.1 hypothetical protein [Azospirillum sp.]